MLENNDNIVEEGLNELTSVFKGKTRIEGFLRSLISEFQIIEDVLQDFLENFSVLTAVGSQLNIIGEIVGENRGGKSDSDYRNYIIAKIGQNTSKGIDSQVISVFNLLTGSDNPFLLELYNAEVEIYADADISALDTDNIKNFIQIMLSAGVKLVGMGYYDPDDYFGFDEDPFASGFGDTGDPAEGGTLASLV